MGKIKVFSVVLSEADSPFYFPGSRVEGHVVVEITTPQNVKSISIAIFGMAFVKWKTFCNNYYLTILSDTVKPLWGNGHDSLTLAAGRHEFPFSFDLPDNLPTSYESHKSSRIVVPFRDGRPSENLKAHISYSAHH